MSRMRRENEPVLLCTARRVSSCSACTVSGAESRDSSVTLGFDRDVGATLTDVEIQVSVDVGDVEKFLEVVRRDVAFVLELSHRGLGVLGHGLSHEPLPFFFARFLPTGC